MTPDCEISGLTSFDDWPQFIDDEFTENRNERTAVMGKTSRRTRDARTGRLRTGKTYPRLPAGKYRGGGYAQEKGVERRKETAQ